MTAITMPGQNGNLVKIEQLLFKEVATVLKIH